MGQSTSLLTDMLSAARSCPQLSSKTFSIASGEALLHCVDCAAVAVAVKLAVTAAWQPYLPDGLLAAQLTEMEQPTDFGANASLDPGSYQALLNGTKTIFERHPFQGWMPKQAGADSNELRSNPGTEAAQRGALLSTTRTRASIRLPFDSCTRSHGGHQPWHAASSGRSLASKLVRYRRSSEDMALPSSIGPAQPFPLQQPVLPALASNKQADDATLRGQPQRMELQHSSRRPLDTPRSNSSASGQTWFSSWNAQPLVGATEERRRASESILSLDDLASGVFARLCPSKLNRADIKAARALHQVDSKFVPVVCGSMLAMIDQHAAGEVCKRLHALQTTQAFVHARCADERVRLERLRGELLLQVRQPAGIISQPLKAMVSLDMSVVDCKNLEAFQDQIEGWGWRWCWQQDGSMAGAPRPLLLSHVPLLWGTTLTATDLKVIMHAFAAKQAARTQGS